MWKINSYRGGNDMRGNGFMVSKTTYTQEITPITEEPELKMNSFDSGRCEQGNVGVDEPEPLEIKEHKKYKPGERLLKKINKSRRSDSSSKRIRSEKPKRQSKGIKKKGEEDDIDIDMIEQSIKNLLKTV